MHTRAKDVTKSDVLTDKLQKFCILANLHPNPSKWAKDRVIKKMHWDLTDEFTNRWSKDPHTGETNESSRKTRKVAIDSSGFGYVEKF